MKKQNLLAAYFLTGAFLITGCESKNSDKDERIEALEQKISQLEQGQVTAPANTQSLTPVDPGSLAEFEFESTEYDFGTINEGEVIEHQFEFTNTGQSPLVISNVQASCGCTSPDWTKTPVKPGDTGFIKVVFNSTAKSGVQSPTVSIQANTSPSLTRLRLKGTVNQSSASNRTLGPVRR